MSTTSFGLTSNITTLAECAEGLFSWTGGKPPYTVSFSGTFSQSVAALKINFDQNSTTLETRFPYSTGSTVSGLIFDANEQLIQLHFAVTVNENGTVCHPSSNTVIPSGPVQTYNTTPTSPASFTIKGLTSDLHVPSCSPIEVNITSNTSIYVVSLFPQLSNNQLPTVQFGINGNTSVIFLNPYLEGTPFVINVDNLESPSDPFAFQNSTQSQIITSSPGNTSCALGNLTAPIGLGSNTSSSSSSSVSIAAPSSRITSAARPSKLRAGLLVVNILVGALVMGLQIL